MKLGAHVSIAGGLSKSIERAVSIGAECLQIFASSPQSFKKNEYSDEELEKFTGSARENKLGPIFFHGVYLVNLAAESDQLYMLSIESLVSYLRLCEGLPVEGVIFHIGSHKGKGFNAVKGRILKAVEEILTRTRRGKLILENNAGQGGGVGADFSEIGELLKDVGSPRLGVCLDSQHAFAAGYSVHTPDGLGQTLTEFGEKIGLDRLVVIHLNDSKTSLGSFKDRHENIGEGFIGRPGIRNILNHPKFSKLPFIIETPGFDGHGPDRKNLDILRRLRYS